MTRTNIPTAAPPPVTAAAPGRPGLIARAGRFLLLFAVSLVTGPALLMAFMNVCRRRWVMAAVCVAAWLELWGLGSWDVAQAPALLKGLMG